MMVSYRRVYEDTIKKYAIDKGITGVSLIFVMFLLLSSRGDITITGYSNDSKCAGTEYDLCYAYLNFTANTDIYIYPSDNMTWAFNTRPEDSMKNIVMQRSWGTGWRTINLSKTWTYKTKYSVKFSKDRDYQLRFIGYKHNISDDVKWGFGFPDGDYDTNTEQYIDPSWNGYTDDDFFIELVENKGDFTSGYGIFDFKNPLNKDIIINNKTIGAFFNVTQGEIINYDYEILGAVNKDIVTILDKAKETKEIEYKDCVYIYKNNTRLVWNNITEQFDEIIETVIDNKTCETKTKTVDYIQKLDLKHMGDIIIQKEETIRIKITANYTPNTIVDWQPTMIIENIIFKQSKWAWWNSTFDKRVNVTIDGTGLDVPDNYQLKLTTISYDSDMQSNFVDIRTTWYNTTSAAEQEIDHWFETKTDGTSLVLWVEVPEISNTVNTTVYYYYDNSTGVTTQSSAADTLGAEIELFYTFTGNSNDTVGTNNASNSGATLRVDRFGNSNEAYYFDGNHYMNFSDIGIFSGTANNFSISYWFNSSNTGNEEYHFTLRGETAMVLKQKTNKIYVRLNQGGWRDGVGNTNGTVASDNWYHVVYSYDIVAGWRLFINGSNVENDTTTGAITVETNHNRISGEFEGSIKFIGDLDDIRFYNSTLTEAQVLSMYLQTAPVQYFGAEESDDTAPTVALNTPADTAAENSLTISFVYTPSDDSGFANCSLWTNETAWSLKHSNGSAINNGTTNTISETFSATGNFVWNVECYDDNNNESFAAANYTVNITSYTTTIYFDHVNSALDVEQGTAINITANSSSPNEVCLSADHGTIGDDYICANSSVSLLWDAESNIRKFNESELYMLYNFSAAGSMNMTLYPIRNRSEIETAYLNISGISPYADDIMIDLGADGSIEWSSWGELQSSNIVTTKYNNSNVNQSVVYTDRGVSAAYLRIPTSMNVTSATLDLYGDTNDNYSNDYSWDVFKNSSRSTSDISVPTIVYNSDDGYMYLFSCGCLSGICGDSFANATMKQEIDGHGVAGVTELKTDVPWKSLYSNAVYKSGANSGVYLYGGYDGVSDSTASNNTYHYNTVTDAWTKKTDMPHMKYGHQSVLVDNDDKIYICGGYNESGDWNKSCFYYDISDNAYTAMAALPRGLEMGWAEQLNSTDLLFYGGRLETLTYGGEAYKYNIAGDSWTTMDHLGNREANVAGAKIGGDIYSFGGYKFGAQSSVYKYNVSADDWDVLDDMSYDWVYKGITYTFSVKFTNDECAEVDNHIVCYGSGGFGYGQQEYIMYFYPYDVSLLVEDYDTISESYSGDMTGKEDVGEFATEINDQLQSCTADSLGYCNLSLYLSNYGAGTITASNLYISTVIPTIDLGTYDISCGTTDCDINIEITSTGAGNVNVTDVSINFLGTSIINWTGSLGSVTDSLNMSIYHSDWDYTIANNYDYIEFIPSTPTSTEVTPHGQTSARGILNITTENYGGKNMSWYLKANDTDSCVNLTFWNSSTYASGHLDDATWYEYQNNVDSDTNFEIWMWADYDCSLTAWDLWTPTFFFRGCCEGCTCSEDVS